MTRRMSCSITVLEVETRTKTVTRRHVDTWKNLRIGERLTLVEKAMGLRKGEKQRILAEVEIVDVRVEPLVRIADAGELEAEGFPGWTPEAFVDLWLRTHGYLDIAAGEVDVRRIEWRYA